MRKALSITSIIGATVTAIVCADIGLNLVAIISTAYMTFWLYANTVAKKKPRSAKRSNEEKIHTKILDFNSTRIKPKTQVQKTWTPDGIILTKVHIVD